MEWEKKSIENDIDGQNGIAYNTLCYIQKGSQKIQSLISPLPELRKEQIINRVKEEGLYSFGGKKSNG